MNMSRDERPWLIFRKTRENRYTLPPLLGILEGEGLSRDFRIQIADSPQQAIDGALGRGLLCFSFMTPQLDRVRKEVERLRQRLGEEALFIAGGAHATGDPEGTRGLGFDFVFAGEGEETFPSFLRGYLHGKLPDASVLWGARNSCVFSSHPPHALEQRFFSPVEITRGCFYSCAFCQTPRIFGHHLRHRPAEQVAGHLRRSLFFGYRQTAFISPNAFSYGSTSCSAPDLGAIEELLGACREAGLEGLHFGCYPSEVRPDWVHPGVLRIVRRYCRNKTIVLGAQTGSDDLLARLQRGHKAADALRAARWIREAGFRPHVDFVFGFPEEEREDRLRSLRLMETMISETGAKIHAHTFMPLPGTPLGGSKPASLDDETRESLLRWEKEGRLDGWWREQEEAAWKILAWRERGWIKK